MNYDGDRPIIETIDDAIEWFEDSIDDEDEWHRTKCPDCAANRIALAVLREKRGTGNEQEV